MIQEVEKEEGPVTIEQNLVTKENKLEMRFPLCVILSF